MDATRATTVGRVSAIWRYPIKSMLGESLEAVEVAPQGLQGDRAFALVDAETGKVVSAKDPRRWPNMFAFRAALGEGPGRVTLPDGQTVTTDDGDIERRLSDAVGRPVRLARSSFEGATAEGYWPDHDWLDQPDQAFEFPLPPGTFFDGATVHLLTTSTLERLRQITPDSRFEVARFRANFVIETTNGPGGFVEDGWVGRTLSLGDVALRVERPCPRCVMTTLPQGDLPKDPAVLRTAVQNNGGNVGVYASVVRGGRVERGSEVSIS
jgi:uncharacterized protein YcbX